jgi:CRISPR system Cascade subunit CasB
MPRNERDMVLHLKELARNDDRGALAAMRKGLGKPPGTVPEMFEHVLPFISQRASAADEDASFLLASLFASYPDGSGQGDMGAVFKRIGQATGSDSVESRFVAMLKCHGDELPDHLRHAVALARSKESLIDWDQLLYDIKHWDDEDRSVQRRWGRSYWETPE